MDPLRPLSIPARPMAPPPPLVVAHRPAAPVIPVKPAGPPGQWPPPHLVKAQLTQTSGWWSRLKEGWQKAWAPSWAGVPQWVHNCWVWSGKVGGDFHAKARTSAVGRAVINGLGHVMATVWWAVDKLAPLWSKKPPAYTPTAPLGQPLPRFPGPLTWLSTRGNQIVDEAGKPVRLRGTNLSGLEYRKTANPVTDARLASLSAMGANVVRVPLNQGWAMSDPEYLARLDDTVRRASARGVYVLFDMHWIDSHQTATPDTTTIEMWRQLAHRYRENPGVLYDLHNEPGMIGWKTNVAWAEAIIGPMRQVNPRSLVMVEGTNKGQRIADAVDHPVKAPNVVYQVHVYGPRQHGPGVGPAQWDRLFGKAAEKLPVFVGEFGGEHDELPAMADMLAYLDKKGIGWAPWHTTDGEVFNADGTLAPLGQLAAQALRR